MPHSIAPEVAMPLTKVKEKYQVTIPTEVRKAAGLAVGDLLEATAHGTQIVLTPKVVVDKESLEAVLAETLADKRAGRVYGPFKSMRDLKRSLRRK